MGNEQAEQTTYTSHNRRTVAEIHGGVVKQGKRGAVSRFFNSKGDKDKIAVWRYNLVRVLHVFNVRSVGSTGHSRLIGLLSD